MVQIHPLRFILVVTGVLVTHACCERHCVRQTESSALRRFIRFNFRCSRHRVTFYLDFFWSFLVLTLAIPSIASNNNIKDEILRIKSQKEMKTIGQNLTMIFSGVGTLLLTIVFIQMILFHFVFSQSSTTTSSSSSHNLGRYWMMEHVHPHETTRNSIHYLPFQGVYPCRNVLESYGAAWLTTKTQFLTISQHPYKSAMRNTTKNWTLTNVQWGEPDSMEIGSELVLKRFGGALRTMDVLEFAVEHLSGYSKFLRHDQKADGTDWKTKEIIRIVQERIHKLQTSQIATKRNQLPIHIRQLADRVLVIIPFHAASGSPIFGGINTKFRGKTGLSYTETRNWFFQATLTSLSSSLLTKIAVFVDNVQDYQFCQSLKTMGYPLIEINLLSNIPDNRFLPEATVYEVERRMVQPGFTMYDEFDYIYFTEADQILRLRPYQIPDLLLSSASSRDDSTTLLSLSLQAVITPHRLASIPHPQDFHSDNIRHQVLDSIGTSKKKFGQSKFLAMEEKPVILWYDDDDGSTDDNPYPLRCCMDPKDDGRNHHRHWVSFTSSSSTLHDDTSKNVSFGSSSSSLSSSSVSSSSPPPMITLLNVGPYHVINGDADLWKFEWRTCRLERDGRPCVHEK